MRTSLPKLSLYLLLLWASNAHSENLPASVTAALQQANIPLQHVGIIVWDTDQDTPQISINPHYPFNPASTMKLVTSYAALSLLGPAYTWQTEVGYDGVLHDGILDGNLYLKGNGDPSLTTERFWLLLHQLRLGGLQRINGDLIIDQSHFQLAPSTVFDDKPYRAYNALPAATMIDYNSTTVYLKAENGLIQLHAEPLPTNTRLINQLSIDSSPCGEWRDAIHTEWLAGTRQLTFSGAYSRDCGEKTFAVSLGDASELVADLFVTLWPAEGGIFNGNWHTGMMPDNAHSILFYDSPPLALAVYNLNKYSNNVMARDLFLSLSQTTPASTETSAVVVHDWLAQQNLSFPELVIDNGAGLSRIARISADSMARLLRSAYHSPVFPELAAALPIVAVDGTMKKRDRNCAVAAHAHIKTGTLDNIKTMAGYVTMHNGHTAVIVFFIDDSHAAAGAAAQDALLEWIYQGG